MINIDVASITTPIFMLLCYALMFKNSDKERIEHRANMDMIIRAFKSRDVIEYADTSPSKDVVINEPAEYVQLENIDPDMLLKKITNENK